MGVLRLLASINRGQNGSGVQQFGASAYIPEWSFLVFEGRQRMWASGGAQHQFRWIGLGELAFE
jgi:hypothetical protein